MAERQGDVEERLLREVERWLQRKAEEAGTTGAVFGLSGGIDSAVVGGLCRRVFGKNCLALIMPCHSDPADLEAAQRVVETFSLPHLVVDLSGFYDQALSLLNPGSGDVPFADRAGMIGTEETVRLAEANLKARLRMCVLYFHANLRNWLVIGTGNRSEWEIGYFTKYGDGAADLHPIGGLTKREVRRIAHRLGVPEIVIQRPPSAGLWPGQTDEQELGLTYQDLDRYLEGKPVSPAVRDRIEKLRAASAHKRSMPPVGPAPARKEDGAGIPEGNRMEDGQEE